MELKPGIKTGNCIVKMGQLLNGRMAKNIGTAVDGYIEKTGLLLNIQMDLNSGITLANYIEKQDQLLSGILVQHPGT